MSTETPPEEAEPVSGFWRLVPEPSLDVVRRWGWASVVANIGIVVTGGLVRLTGSGLGCPTWPQCTDQSYVPHSALGIHGAIEFGNRMLGFVVAVIAICTWLVVMRYRPIRRDLRRLATAAALGVPLQAVIGGISVLTGLNPWIVSAHFLVSPVIITLTVSMVRRSRTSPYPHTPPVVRALATACRRGGLADRCPRHLGHRRRVRTRRSRHRAERVQRGADQPAARGRRVRPARNHDRTGDRHPRDGDLRNACGSWPPGCSRWNYCQGAVGFTQYFTGLPWGLVLVHMFFAGLLIALVTAVYAERGTPAT